MNRIARLTANLTVATGLAAAALTVGATAAHAEVPHGPGQLQVAPHTDPQGPVIGIPTPAPEPDPLPAAPEPQGPKPKPQVDGLDEITDKPDCTHGCGGGGGDVPDDKAPAPQDEPTPNPGEDPAQDAPLDQGCFSGCDLPEQDTPAGEVEDVRFSDITTPTRIDAGQDAAAATVVASDQGSETGLGYYVGLGLVSIAGAFGVALAARRLSRKEAAQA